MQERIAYQGITFDERLPLYAWLEDSDFRGQAERRGPFVKTNDVWGVHLGHKHGRHNGLTLGYSQVANAVYLAKKGTVPARFLAAITGKNVLINALRSLRPEPFVVRSTVSSCISTTSPSAVYRRSISAKVEPTEMACSIAGIVFSGASNTAPR